MIPEIDVFTVLRAIGVSLITIGSFYEVIGAIGLNRLPDFFTRAHAVTIAVIGGSVVPLIGIAFLSIAELRYEGIYVSTMCIITAILILITSPTGTHLLLKAAWRGRKPVRFER